MAVNPVPPPAHPGDDPEAARLGVAAVRAFLAKSEPSFRGR